MHSKIFKTSINIIITYNLSTNFKYLAINYNPSKLSFSFILPLPHLESLI